MLHLRSAAPGALLSLVWLSGCDGGGAGEPAPATTLGRAASEGELEHWLTSSQGALAASVLHSTAARSTAGSSTARASAKSRAAAHRPRVEVALPERAELPFTLADPRSQLSIRVQLAGAQAVAARSSGALRFYPDALGTGRALLLRESEQGIEDYVSLPAAPAEPYIEYELELGPDVHGLRLVARTLEFLDAGGAPRLRVAPPVVIGADGARIPAQLELEGCSADTSPAAPWGRELVDPGADSCRVRVAWSPERVTYPALVDPLWSSAGALSEPRVSFASLALPDGKLLVAGGLSAAATPLASAELYDPASDSWSVTGGLLEARASFTLSARAGKGGPGALAVGGKGAGGALASTELYDPESGLWSPGPVLPEAYVGHGAVRFESGDLLVAGGSTTQRASLLAAGASQWTAAGELLASEPASSLTALADGDALLVGPNAPSAQRYSAASNDWRPSGEPVLARSGHSATRMLDGSVLIAGGGSSRSAERYDPVSESFQLVGAMNEPRALHSATLLPDGRVAVIGGNGIDGAIATELYNPQWGTWVAGPGTAQGRAAHQAELLGSGQVLALGGRGLDGDALASADLLDPAPPPTTIAEYKLPARLDTEVTSTAITELWAAVARPATLVPGRRYPVLLFLHGNHATCGRGENPREDSSCEYTSSGVCPDGFVVVPSHRGYDYVAVELAQRGFIVVSVNANRGITCGGGEEDDFGFNLARGRLMLQHLRALSDWDRGAQATPDSLGVSLEGQLDLGEVGLMGHSRGGEGVRAAYEQYRDVGSPWPRRIAQPVTFRALFEIGPVDGQTSRVLNADGVAWNVLLPMCDGDVSDLQGVQPFDRMLALQTELRETPKSAFVAWGTNHNFFNTEWQQSDSEGCQDHRALFSDGPGITGSAEQRQIGLRSMLTFFLAHVGKEKNPALSQLFDPASPVELDTRVDRAYTPSLRPNRGFTLEDFSGPSDRSQGGQPTLRQELRVAHGSVPEHDPSLRAALVSFPVPDEPPRAANAAPRFLQIPFSAQPGGVDLGGYTHLEFRVGRAGAEELAQPTPMLVQVLNADGSLSDPVSAESQGVRLDGPVGGPFGTHVVLQAARIPFRAFAGVQQGAVRGVRFSFPGAAGARVFLADLRAGLGSASLSPIQPTTSSRAPATGGTSPAEPALSPPAASNQVVPGTRPRVVRQLVREGNGVVALRALQNGAVEIELGTQQPFQPLGDQLVLNLGNVRSVRSRHPGGALSRVVFTVDGVSFNQARDGVNMQVSYASNAARQWDFGPLNKAALRP